jgi:arylsulfatase A
MKISKFSLLGTAILLNYACSHPIEIVGEGDVTSASGNRNCSLENYQAGDDVCSKNYAIGAYVETYYATPRAGWTFDHWATYCASATPPNYEDCSFNIPADDVRGYWGETVPPLKAVFRLYNPVDTDGDGTPDNVDTDDDNDGILDVDDACSLNANLSCGTGIPTRYPNIVLILVDDLGYGDVRANFSESMIATPHIDQLAHQGMRFTDAHSGAGVCSPTRYGILTGQHFSRQDWSRIPRQLGQSMIDDERLTLGDLLQGSGYHTGAFGKWHLGQTFYDNDGQPGSYGADTDWLRPMTGGPNDRGFNDFFGVLFTQGGFLLALVSDRLATDVPTEVQGNIPKVADYEPVDAMPAATQNALDYIDWNASNRPDQPFFLYYASVAIHTPLVPSPEFIGQSSVGIYGDFVMQTDAAVGKIVAKIEEHRLREDTLIIFTSDNGSHGRAGNGIAFPPGSVRTLYGHKPNGDWRGYKGSIWEGGHRVPFIGSWPGHIQPNTVSDELIVLEDLMDTIAAILEVELPAHTAEDSYNILPYLDGTHTGPPIRDYAVLSSFNGDPIMRKGKWVLSFGLGPGSPGTENPEPKPDGPKGQLYNLEADPGETVNVWLNNPDVVAELTALHEAHVARGSSFGIER